MCTVYKKPVDIAVPLEGIPVTEHLFCDIQCVQKSDSHRNSNVLTGFGGPGVGSWLVGVGSCASGVG